MARTPFHRFEYGPAQAWTQGYGCSCERMLSASTAAVCAPSATLRTTEAERSQMDLLTTPHDVTLLVLTEDLQETLRREEAQLQRVEHRLRRQPNGKLRRKRRHIMESIRELLGILEMYEAEIARRGIRV